MFNDPYTKFFMHTDSKQSFQPRRKKLNAANLPQGLKRTISYEELIDEVEADATHRPLAQKDTAAIESEATKIVPKNRWRA